MTNVLTTLSQALQPFQFYFIEHPWSAGLFFFLLGSFLGSYFNVFAWRWPQIQEKIWLQDIQEWFTLKGWTFPQEAQVKYLHLGLMLPSSFCPHCQTPIPFYLNLPIVGWFILRGRSQCCDQPISFKYPLFELICASLSLFGWLHYQNLLLALLFFIFAMALCMASQTDFESLMLPDSITFFLMFSGLIFSVTGLSYVTPFQSVFGILFGYLSLAAIRQLGFLLFKKEAMGVGDLKFLGAICAWVGFAPLIQLILLSSVFGIIFSLFNFIFKMKFPSQSSTAIPFGPFLALSGLVTYLYPSLIL